MPQISTDEKASTGRKAAGSFVTHASRATLACSLESSRESDLQ